jgi:hypothetical protein
MMPTLAVTSLSDSAYAGVPFAQTAYTGPTAHGRYTVELTPECSDPNMGSYCEISMESTKNPGLHTPPTELYVILTTHPAGGTKCKASGYEFDATALSAGGAFSTTAYFSSGSPQLTFTVKGTFLTAGVVRGTVTGNFGCGTDSFTIALKPQPILSTDPCVLLADVHAARYVAPGQPISYASPNNSFNAQGGRCQATIGKETAGTGLSNISGLQLYVAANPAGLESGQASQDGEPYTHHVPLPGLGAGASLYYNNHYVNGKATSSIGAIEIDFRHGALWASIGRTPTYGHCECFSPAGFVGQKNGLFHIAKALQPLLH